jgi:hypothetical protein
MTGVKSLRWTKRAIFYSFDILGLNTNSRNMDFLKDLWAFMKARKKWWLAPLIIVLLLIGVLIVLGGSSAIAPFIYTLF